MSLRFILICLLVFATFGCASDTHKGVASNIPKWVLVVDESGNPLSDVAVGVQVPIPFVNQKTNKRGKVRIGYKSLLPSGFVSLSKVGYIPYFDHYENLPDTVVLKKQ